MAGRGIVVRCPACLPWAGRISRANGSRLAWSPEATYVGYRVVPTFLAVKAPPPTCPNCGTRLERRSP